MKIGNLRRAAYLLVLIAIWEAASRLAGPAPAIPAPSTVASTLVRGARDGWLFGAVLTSMRRLVLGFSVAAASGLVLGLLLGRVRLLSEALGLCVYALAAVPSACWIPVALIVFGPSESAVLFIVVVYPLFNVAIATENAVRAVSPIWVRAGRGLGARGARLYVNVVLPAALPGILTGMRLGWSFGWRALMGGELLASSGGLGQKLIDGKRTGDLAQVLAVTMVVALISVGTDRLIIGQLERSVRERWGYDRS